MVIQVFFNLYPAPTRGHITNNDKRHKLYKLIVSSSNACNSSTSSTSTSTSSSRSSSSSTSSSSSSSSSNTDTNTSNTNMIISSTPNLPTNIVHTNIDWLKLSGKSPVDMRIPPIQIKIMLESPPLKSTMLVGRLGRCMLFVLL